MFSNTELKTAPLFSCSLTQLVFSHSVASHPHYSTLFVLISLFPATEKQATLVFKEGCQIFYTWRSVYMCVISSVALVEQVWENTVYLMMPSGLPQFGFWRTDHWCYSFKDVGVTRQGGSQHIGEFTEALSEPRLTSKPWSFPKPKQVV